MNLNELTDHEKKRILIIRRWGSITAFAQHLGVSRQAVGVALKGKGKMPKLELRIKNILEKEELNLDT